ncbi:hypothetical protein ZWY2020_047967 [Hordeum vulgare]|nr:hypothetical protein ZWY2020_047967 [Hordeum vulgare]
MCSSPCSTPRPTTSPPTRLPGHAVCKNYSCLASCTYLTNTTYTIPSIVPLNATAPQVAYVLYGGLVVHAGAASLSAQYRDGAPPDLRLLVRPLELPSELRWC